MEDLYSSIWLHNQIIDEMKQNLQNTLFELETLKMESKEKSITHKEEINKLLNLLKLTQQQRDEARQHLSQFLSQIQIQIPNSTITITESNDFSHDGSSSPSSSDLSSFFDPLPHPPLILEDPTANHQLDPLDALVIGKAFPETGKLLKAVVEAGPLLETLLVAGPLPEWVNPPPPPQTPQTQRFELPSPPLIPPRSDSVMCSVSVLRVGFDLGSVIDQPMLTGKRQRLE